jgi:hypothetical protein
MTEPIVGIDFDNTIAIYDRVFHDLAVERGLIDAAVPRSKRHVRDAVRLRADGESHWRRLQASAYGTYMADAAMAPGVAEFLARCRDSAIPVYVISHRTRFAALDESGVLLRDAAIDWMRAQGLFGREGLGLRAERVYFESTRAEKIDRLARLECSHFVDDLAEVLQEPAFPVHVVRVWYAPDRDGLGPDLDGVRTVTHWDQVHEVMFGRP